MDKSKKSDIKKERRKKITEFEILRHNVAGIDVSDNGGMMVAYRVLRTQYKYPISSTEIVIDEFECYRVLCTQYKYTRDLRDLSATLKSHGIESVAMESTGVYWVPLLALRAAHVFLLLQEDGFEVYLVNSKHVKNVTGRKKDEDDAEWLHVCLRPVQAKTSSLWAIIGKFSARYLYYVRSTQ